MNSKSKWLASVLIAGGLIIGALAYAQIQNRDTAPHASPSKVTYKNYIWIEGEHAVSTNFAREPIYNYFCSNNYALQLAKDVDPPSGGYYATYVFYVTHTKEYDMWLGCTPPGSIHADRPGYASPIEWKINDGPFQTASAENVYVKNFYGIGGYYWVKISTGTLNAGKHTLTIRVNQKRSSGWDYYFYLDAVLFLARYSIDFVELMHFPEAAPRDFTTPGVGILFNTVDFYENKLRTNINDRETLFTLIQIYGWLYEYNKAIFLLQKFLEKNPRDIQLRLHLAAFYSWSDQLDAAISEYKNIIAIDEKNITARKLLAVLAGWNNRYDEAIKYYHEIISIDPDNADAYISLATQYSWKGEMNRAIATFEKAEAIAPNDVNVLEALGDNYFWAGRVHDSMRQYYRIIDIDEKHIAAYKKLARIYLDVGESGKAQTIISKARDVIDLYPELSGISLDIKDELARERRELIASYKEALTRNPEDVNLRKGLIDTYIWNRMRSEAVQEYDVLLAYKMFHAMGYAQQKLTRLMIRTVGLKSAAPVLKTMRADVNAMQRRNAVRIEKSRRGALTTADEKTLAEDSALLGRHVDTLKQIEKELLLYNDITSAFGKDVQTYIAMQAATNWQFEPDRIEEYASTAVALNPHLYQPYKVLGTIEQLYGKPARAVDYLEKTREKSANAEFPLLSLAYAQTGNYSKAIEHLKKALDSTKIAGAYKNDIQTAVSITAMNGAGREDSSAPEDLERHLTAADALLSVIMEDCGQKLAFGFTTMRMVYEKNFLDNELDNVRIYREMANFHLQNNNYNASRDYTEYILEVQPLNVTANFNMGHINELLGLWKDAMHNYEICIDALPTFEHAQKAHYEIQKRYAPSITTGGIYFSDNIRSRYGAELTGRYELGQFMSLQAGYGYTTQSDAGGITITGQPFHPSEGDVTMHNAFAQITVPLRPLAMWLNASVGGNVYSGNVDYNNPLYDSSVSYVTLNYGVGVVWNPPVPGVIIRASYHHKDENELTQSLRMKFRDEITYNEIEGIADIHFAEYDFPLSDRLFLYSAVQYRMLSDTNTRISNYNNVTVRAYRMPKWNMTFDVAGIYNYEDTKFDEYASGDILPVPYWAPMAISYYGPMLKVSQRIDNVLQGSFDYSLSLQYMRTSLDQTMLMPGISLSQTWDRVNIFAQYLYNHVTLPESAEGAYISHDLRFGAGGKFFTIYSPKGTAGKPVLFVSVNPTLITPDGDGRNDFAQLSLTAFDEKGISQWWIEIVNEKGEKIQEYSMAGAVPATYRWDGTNKMNVLAPEGKYYIMLTIQNTAGEKFTSQKQDVFLSPAKRAAAIVPTHEEFSPNGDKIKDTVRFVIQATDKRDVEQWFITISSKNKTVKTIRGNDFIPFDAVWDGYDENVRIVPDGEYTAVMTIKYDDVSIRSTAAAVNVITRVAIDIKAEPGEIVPVQTSLRITPATGGKIEQWQVRILREDGAVMKLINGAGMPPKVIAWDGTDDKGEPIAYNLPLGVEMEVTDAAGNSAVSQRVPFMAGFLIKQQKDKRIVYLFNQGIMFAGRSSELTPQGIAILEQLSAKLIRMGGFNQINIVAHTDSIGSRQSNIALSQRQASAIANGLKNVPSEIKTTGAGAELPYIKNRPSKWDMRYEIELY